ncbi:MAG: hypothetical protein COV74_10830 [Candidatus Omnitrophica bacterium CG11_big_fil_rev_8_21_14_0_20_45_26]|uniref:BAX inhibitor (BI)-1/YccA family protein n=1 Tax=Candidatus Abzuiibacterium crystallinum TaxID=1974748 RepID=A0A2H0LL03_9BACT|nr:MAG: hypothetical protein COV74_10830 [Candidatus Omnitrophica bacterium CG11_big_fil_rev_8_21_14_0_20_45_26]PIW63840.1 MAG: hypothetical protein COW12_07980 [Candidatus Omnitrophica bacterium CG12_big_fil_rev_8_21_14_0_65_45_16]
MSTPGPMEFGLSRAEESQRNFLSQVYLWMAMGLGLTGFVAWIMAGNPSVVVGLMRSPFLFMMLAIVQIGIVFWLSASIMNISVSTATMGFSIYATLNGVLFSSLFLVYTAGSIASTFFVTAGTFAAVSVYGYATKRDLTSIGSFCFMALIGIILASIVNWFLKSPMMYWLITYAGIAIFIGLTAYDTQQLKRIHESGSASGAILQKLSLLGALKLYLDFINLFIMLLRVMGRRR